MLDIKITNKEQKIGMLSQYVKKLYDGDVLFVDLITSEGVLQFVAYNAHNGEYGHHAVVISNQIHYETSL